MNHLVCALACHRGPHLSGGIHASWDVSSCLLPSRWQTLTLVLVSINAVLACGSQEIVSAFNTAFAATVSGNVSAYVAARAHILQHVQLALVQATIVGASDTETARKLAGRRCC